MDPRCSFTVLRRFRVVNRPLLGVVTVTYNSARFLEEFVRSCRDQKCAEFRVYCIDNDSTDGTQEILREMTDPGWKITFNRTNVGIAAGNNEGIRQAIADDCQWVLLLNNDTSFDEELFGQLIEACRINNWCVVVPKIYYDRPAGHIWYGGGGFNLRRGYTGYHAGINQCDVGQCDRGTTVEYSPTCAMLVRSSVFAQVGLMDEAYFVYFDDTDFCWRLRERAIVIGYCPRATLIHKVGGSTGGITSPFTARFTARNRLYFLRKHFGAWRACLWIPIFIFYYVGRYLIRRRSIACFKASIGGTFSWWSMMPRVPELPQRRRDS